MTERKECPVCDKYGNTISDWECPLNRNKSLIHLDESNAEEDARLLMESWLNELADEMLEQLNAEEKAGDLRECKKCRRFVALEELTGDDLCETCSSQEGTFCPHNKTHTRQFFQIQGRPAIWICGYCV